MNKPRRLSRPKKFFKDVETKVIYDKGRKYDDFDERVFPNVLTNRSCYFSPDQRDAGQLTDYVANDENQKILQEQNGSCCQSKDMQEIIKELKNIIHDILPKGKRNSKDVFYSLEGIKEVSLVKLQGNDNVNEFDKYAYEGSHEQQTKGQSKDYQKKVYISDEPHIKVIAEKFSRYKNNNVELRKLKERVVCIEYDVYIQGEESNSEPFQKLRAYFSVKPVSENEDDTIPKIPSAAKRHCDIADEDFKNVCEGIEMIDANIPENKSYLEGLKNVLKRQQTIKIKKNKAFNPMYLYQMAKRDNLLSIDYSCTDFFSKAELDEIKDLIMKKTTSSAHGISRRKLRPEKDDTKIKEGNEEVKKTIIEDLFRDIQL
ncbi:unnamed protein product [Parnassius apollo]|uniref:(apollo) hypothetical protein n=1 Tax=Parnassius apollo TaxID=110799 RepID=A0A8S3W1G3_PARAO|nr:unnamed protein product [Parnassius apollo]